jgi:hypothetical protein
MVVNPLFQKIRYAVRFFSSLAQVSRRVTVRLNTGIPGALSLSLQK